MSGNVMGKLKNHEEMNPDGHDGCYELIRTVVEEYKNVNESVLDYKDLNAIYLMTIGTWKYNFDNKRETIRKSHLLEKSKEKILLAIDRIETKAQNDEYTNSFPEGQKSIGLFGAGFLTFSKNTDNDSTRRFIKLCLDIIDINDDHKNFDIAEITFKNKIKGMQAGVASMILHCLKPFTFPILNRNMGKQNIYEYLDVDLDKKGKLETYIDNCRKIKKFRDENFNFKNYRIFDLASEDIEKEINPLAKIIEEYKKQFEEVRKGEIYKWKAVKWFQDNWDINSENFPEMLKESLGKTYNLLNSMNYYPQGMICAMAIKEPDRVREMFKNLFDESQDLEERIEEFKQESDRMKDSYDEYKDKAHFQTLNAISVYLFLRYPEKYYIYKYNKFKNFSEKIEYDSSDLVESSNRVINYYEMCNEVLAYIEQDSELLEMSRNSLGEDDYKDENYHILTEDIVFFGNYWDDTIDENEWWPSLEEYDPGISTDKWIEILKDNSIVPDNSLAILNRILDLGGQATCAQLSEKYGESIDFYSDGSFALAKRVWEKTNAPLVTEENDNNKWWPILYLGKELKKEDTGVYIWKLRPELKEALEKIDLINIPLKPYSKERFLSEVYMAEMEYNTLLALLEMKRNVILQGAPGTGKTFAAKRLAYSILGFEDDDKIQMVQFHQNYSYEDFMMGYRPTEEGGFKLKEGLFYEFAHKAEKNPGQKYFLVIDEINRGNLSRIFGELLMLVEKDYRGHKMTLAYTGSTFSVPENLYIIGTMNTADRSLAMIDYALRRRFAFYDMVPGFENEAFVEYTKSLDNEIFDKLITVIKRLNNYIEQDSSLGKGFCIGHSYFCNSSKEKCSEEWISSIIEYEIIPMLREYWFDDTTKVDDWSAQLREVRSE